MNKFVIDRILILVIVSSILIVSIYFSKLLIPFFTGAFIAYLLNPIVTKAEDKKINRNFSALIAIISLLGFIIIFSFSILPLVIQQTIVFLERFPSLIDRAENYFLLLSRALKKYSINIDHISILKDFHNNLGIILKLIINKFFFSSIAIINMISFLLLTPIVSWYFLKDWKKFKIFFINNIPFKYQKNARNNFNEIDRIISSFIRGQVLVSIILGVYYFISFSFIGAEYSIFLGFFSGIFSLIPYFGIIVSFILSSYIIVLQFADINYLLYVTLIFTLSFFLEGYILSPKIIGQKLGLHPLIILYSVFIFGALFGIVGIFFSIPLSCIIYFYYKKILLNLNKEKR